MIKRTLFSLLALISLLTVSAQKSDFSPVDYVNPLVGTQSTHGFSTGNTYPAIARPWGMNF